MRKDNPAQIVRIDGRGCFMEVLSDSFDQKNKVHLGFFSYDESKSEGNRFTNKVHIFLSFGEALSLSEKILSGRLIADAQASARAAGTNFPKEIFKTMGGISAANLASMGQTRPDGKSMAKQLCIYPGTKMPFLLIAANGAGEEVDNGIIKPVYGNKPDNKVSIAVGEEAMMQFAGLVNAHIHAYLCSQYISGAFVTSWGQQRSS